MTIDYNPFDEKLWSDPWPVYEQLRREEPVYYIEKLDAWALTRFEDVWNASMDRQNFTATHGTSPEALLLDPSAPPSVFLFMDPPDHRLHRDLIAGKYTPHHLATLENQIREACRHAIKPGLKAGRIDVYAAASDVALHTIANLIGLQYKDIRTIRGLIDTYYRRKPGHIGTTSDGIAAMTEARRYILELLENFRHSPPNPDSHIHAWLHANVNGRTMDQESLFYSVIALTITGSDTLPLTTAATVNYLAESPRQLAMVRADHELIPSAFAEAARFDQPTNILGRVLANDVEIRGKSLKKGQPVLFLFASANRDEAEFEKADEFLIERKPRRNLSFGTGIHFCLGQHLAKLEGRIFLEELFSSIGDFEVEKESRQRIFGEFLQGFCALPIRFQPIC